MPTKRLERVAVNLELIYADEEDGGEEFSFEELRAIKRGLYGIDWGRIREEEAEDAKETNRGRNEMAIEGRRAPIKVKTVLSPSPNRGKMKRKIPASPTMTFHTRAATNEIYGLFDQPLGESSMMGEVRQDDGSESGGGDESDGEESTTGIQTGQTDESGPENDEDAQSVKSEWSDFVPRRVVEEEHEPVGEATAGLSSFSIHKDDEGEGGLPFRPGLHKISMPSPPDDFDPPRLPYHAAKETQFQGQSRLPYMTPIVERTESLPPPTTARRKNDAAKTPSRSRMPDITSSPESAPSPTTEPQRQTAPPAFSPSPPPSPPPATKEGRHLSAKPPATKGKETTAQKGPIIQDLQCNPMDESLRATIFANLHPPLKTYSNFYDHSSQKLGKAAEIKRFVKAMAKRDGDKTASIASQPPIIAFITGEDRSCYTVKRELGKGAFAPVYLVENNVVADAEDEDEGTGDAASLLARKTGGRRRLEAMKMEHPPCPWEFYMMRQAHRRLGVSRPVESVLHAYEMHLFSDEGYLFLEYRDQGTILDLVNIARADPATGTMDESLVMFLSVELLRTVEALHTVGILHGDLKPDNCLIRFDPAPTWTSRYHRNGANGWAQKGITLIDFGRGIDMRLFSAATQFIADWKTDQQDCAEMREMRPWTYQVDYYGLAAVIHSMLFGKYIETTTERASIATKKYRLAATFKRYWQQEIWAKVFDVLLNPLQYVAAEDKMAMPVTKAIRTCREEMEVWLEDNCEKGIGLKNAIRRMEGVLGKRR